MQTESSQKHMCSEVHLTDTQAEGHRPQQKGNRYSDF